MVAVWDRKAAIRKAWETRRRLGTHRCSDTTKERLRHATSQRIASRMQHGRCISSIEEIVAKELTRLAVPFQRQVGIRSKTTGRYVACADFVLDGRIVLEVNGSFWHADPRSYPDGPAYPSQLRTATAYAKKKDALAVLGIPLVEVWEADLTDNATLAVAQALQKAELPV